MSGGFEIQELAEVNEQDLCDRGCLRVATHVMVEHELYFCRYCAEALTAVRREAELVHEMVSA